MKNFLGTFAISFIFCYLVLLFGEKLLFQNLWALMILISLMMTILITGYINQETKTTDLEERIKMLEAQNAVNEIQE